MAGERAAAHRQISMPSAPFRTRVPPSLPPPPPPCALLRRSSRDVREFASVLVCVCAPLKPVCQRARAAAKHARHARTHTFVCASLFRTTFFVRSMCVLLVAGCCCCCRRHRNLCRAPAPHSQGVSCVYVAVLPIVPMFCANR